VLLTVWLWLVAPPPEAPESTVRWQAPAECPTADELAGRFDELRGDARLTSSFEFVVIAHARRGTYELRIVGTDERYEADDCEALAEAALLLASLALGSEPETTSEPAPARYPSEAERAREAEDVAPFLRAVGVRRIDVRGPITIDTPARLTAEIGLTTMVTPRPALDLFAGVGGRGQNWGVDVGLIARPIFVAPSPEPSVGARMSSVGALARVCVGGRARRYTLAGCASVDVSAVIARATGPVSEARARTQPWTMFELGPELTVPVAGRVSVVMRASGNWLAARPNFTITGAGMVCCRDPIGISARAGVEIGLGERRKPR
jgi:hypothetical protein